MGELGGGGIGGVLRGFRGEILRDGAVVFHQV